MKTKYQLLILPLVLFGCGTMDRLKDAKGYSRFNEARSLEKIGTSDSLRQAESELKGIGAESVFYVRAQMDLAQMYESAQRYDEALTAVDNAIGAQKKLGSNGPDLEKMERFKSQIAGSRQEAQKQKGEEARAKVEAEKRKKR